MGRGDQEGRRRGEGGREFSSLPSPPALCRCVGAVPWKPLDCIFPWDAPGARQ